MSSRKIFLPALLSGELFLELFKLSLIDRHVLSYALLYFLGNKLSSSLIILSSSFFALEPIDVPLELPLYGGFGPSYLQSFWN
jgi:hypothetical protein